MGKNHKKNINGKDSERTGKIRIITVSLLLVRVLCLFFILSFSFFISCSNEGSIENQASLGTNSFEIDEKVCTDFAIKMHTSLVNGDTNFINSYVDWESIKNSIALDSSYWSKIRTEIFDSWKLNISIGKDLIGELASGNHLRFITYYQLDGEHFIVLRNYIEPQTVNYFEFQLIAKGSTIAIADIYDFGQSMLLSQMGKDYCEYYGSFNTNWKTEKVATEKRMAVIEGKLNAGNLKDAYSKLLEMETAFQNTYIYKNLKELILLQSNVESITLNYWYEKSQQIPLNEKGRSLTMFYLNAYAGNNNDALIALANLEDAVGEDGVLNYLKGNLYYENREMQKALEAFNEALAFDNEIFSFHIAKIKTLIEKSLYVEAVESLLVMDDSFEIQSLNWDEEFRLYPDFLSSDAYILWKQRLND